MHLYCDQWQTGSVPLNILRSVVYSKIKQNDCHVHQAMPIFQYINSRLQGYSHTKAYSKIRNFSRGFYFRETAKFREIKTLAKWRNHSVVCWCRKIMPLSPFFNMANMSLNAIRENKILANITKFTVIDVIIVGFLGEKIMGKRTKV